MLQAMYWSEQPNQLQVLGNVGTCSIPATKGCRHLRCRCPCTRSWLRIGLVVDEAHIGLGTETEFGRFCRSLNPDRIVLATATPRDERLNAFLSAAEYPDFEAFTVSRDEVVDAYLNKRYVAAAVYHPTEDWQSLADLQKTVLKRAWEQQGVLKARLTEQGIALTPLMLVQVANGPTAVAEAKEYLVRDCRVPLDVIGTYEGSDKAPSELQRIAQDPSFEVLIFKEAAGTGFDAPRAFILTSTKHVTDMDFAAQFIGRIMRVAAPVRNLLRRGSSLCTRILTADISSLPTQRRRQVSQARSTPCKGCGLISREPSRRFGSTRFLAERWYTRTGRQPSLRCRCPCPFCGHGLRAKWRLPFDKRLPQAGRALR